MAENILPKEKGFKDKDYDGKILEINCFDTVKELIDNTDKIIAEIESNDRRKR